MRRLLIIALTLFLLAPLMAGAESDDAFYPVPESPAEVRATDEARLTDLGFLTESNSDDAYRQAVREFQRYLNAPVRRHAAEGLPATTLEVLGEQKEDASRALSIKPLTTYSEIDAIEAFKAYAVVDNEGELGEDTPPVTKAEDSPEPDGDGTVTGDLTEPSVQGCTTRNCRSTGRRSGRATTAAKCAACSGG